MLTLQHVDKEGKNFSLINKYSELASMQAGYTKSFFLL
jgi:hypothetical protein